MAIPLTVNGAVFEYPETFDENWGVQATGWAQAVTNGMLQRAGGNFPLLADANFGASFGLISTYYKSRSSNIATAGVVRLAVGDAIEWRNNANSANLALGIDGSNNLTFNGSAIGTGGTVNAGTATHLAYYATSTNAVSDANGATVSGNYTLSGVITATITGHSSLDLALTGGTMSGAIDLGANKITGLANGTNPTDAVAFGQLTIPVAAAYTPTITGGGSTSNVNFWWMQVGLMIRIWGYFVTGTVTATTASITIPGTKTIDTTKVTNAGPLGFTSIVVTGNPTSYQALFSDGSSTSQIFIGTISTTGTTLTKNNGNACWNNSQVTQFDFWVPVVS